MSNFPLPVDEVLERLIRESFEYTPGPDMRRLEHLEKRLFRAVSPQSRRPVNTLPWWIVLLLAGGFAAAAWWAGNILTETRETDRQIESSTVTEIERIPGDSDEQGAVEQPVQENGVGYDADRDTPVIDQRETF